jgi:hypothetical protein
MTISDPEPPITDDDTKPRPPQASGRSIQAMLSMLTPLPFERISPPEEPEPIEPETKPRGCSNTLLVAFVLFDLLFLCITAIVLAGVAGYRDGVNDAATLAINTQSAAISTQLPHINQDLAAQDWESLLGRCQYVMTLQPNYPGMSNCISQAEQKLSATPTPAPSLTFTPSPTLSPTGTATRTPNVATITVTSGGSVSVAGITPTLAPVTATPAFLPELFARAQEAIRQQQFETAIGYLEAIRETDATFFKNDVTALLCSTYETVGVNDQNTGQLSEMIVVINKALKMNCHLQGGTGSWEFTVNVTELYLSARDYLNGGNYAEADRVFKLFMSQAPNYLDGKTLACQAFAKAGDTAATQNYCK